MNLYEILEINENASEKEIKKAYHKLSLQYHPDKNKDNRAIEKYQNIRTAYDILIDSKTRIEYCKMNLIQQNNFVTMLQKIFNNEILIEEVKHFGISFDKKDWQYLEENYKGLFDALNFKELINFFKNGKFPKKKIDSTITETDESISEFNENNYESFHYLPVYYQKLNDLDIILNLNISLDDLIENNKRKIKIKRSINGKIIYNNFIFNLSKQYIVFPSFGDSNNNINGNLIIKLNLPKDFFWSENIIILEKSITLFQMLYGLDIIFNYNDINIKYPNWVPSRDGFIIEINQIKNFNLNIKLVLNYEHSELKEKILLKYFS
jgi:curved DNA-binding protein CbpA